MQLESDTLAIPGEESRQSIQILNSGTVVDRFELDVLGEARDWIRIEPAEANVYPDQTVTVDLVFRPPRSADLAAGPVTFGIRVMSHEDIEGSVVEESTVTVGPFTEFGVKLVPTTRRSRTAGRFSAVVDNRGNAPLKAHLYATDADAKVTFAFKHEEVEVAHGKGVVVPLKVKPKKRLWRGADVSLPFQVLVVDEDDDEEEQTADGALIQASVVSDAIAKFALAVVAAVAALLAMWYLLLQPSVESEAKKQVAAATGQDPDALGSSKSPSPGASAGGSGASGGASNGGGSSGSGGTTAGGTGGSAGGGSDDSRYPALAGSGGSTSSGGDTAGSGSDSQLRAVDFRIQSDVKVSSKFVVTSYEIPSGTTYYVSDILFENAAGDTGILRLQRGDSVLMQISMDTYRDRDDHFVEPLEFGPGEKVILSVRCQDPGGQTSTTSDSCTPGAFFSGRAVTSAS
ncbi:hypothetical protein [Streptomyces sp. NPDC051014]|uniref:COG1470 family protein n=1 Tax=Streptomyces sp. NPDC051014 TaxID=3155751 RepID=UPI0034064159